MEQPAVLVTFDNKLALEQAPLIREREIAVAVIDKVGQPDDLTLNEYLRNVVHRHAHRFVEQERGSVFRYRSTRRFRIELP